MLPWLLEQQKRRIGDAKLVERVAGGTGDATERTELPQSYDL